MHAQVKNGLVGCYYPDSGWGSQHDCQRTSYSLEFKK
jgi:hypothetical protein